MSSDPQKLFFFVFLSRRILPCLFECFLSFELGVLRAKLFFSFFDATQVDLPEAGCIFYWRRWSLLVD